MNAADDSTRDAPSLATGSGVGASHVRERSEGEAESALRLPGRYLDLGPVASGGFGEVRRVHDTALERVLAMKLLHPEVAQSPGIRRRFLTEIRITAQLQHPGIVPVYDHGELRDGRLWYAMKEVRGTTLAQILRELFAVSGPEGFGTTASGWSFRRVVDVFARVAQTVAYAHSRGVVHRDLKPDNVMVGEFGEAMVMDWGLARVLGDPSSADGDEPHEPALSPSGGELTRHGDVLGTPAYMPPEQALGARELHGPGSDVYALGAILYRVLTGRAPYEASGGPILPQILAGPPRDIESVARGGPPVPAELVRAASGAMRREIGERCTAEALATDVLAWLDGARRREQALSVLEQAVALEPRMAALRAAEAQAAAEARGLAGALLPFDPVEAKRPVWAKEDESERLGREALSLEASWLEAMHSALRIDPELPEAHAALAGHYREEVTRAEAQQRYEDAARYEALLRSHDRGRHAAFLRGEGAISLLTEPAGAEVRLERYEERDRRLFPRALGIVGTTPLSALPLLRGSYRLRLSAPGRAEVLYPVRVERDTHWDGCPPGEDEPLPIALPREGELGPDEIYVPAGYCWLGGHAAAPDALPRRRLFVDGFVMDRFPVTNGAWVLFLNALLAAGREAEALAACPRQQRGSPDGREGSHLFSRDAAGQFLLPPDWLPDMPVMLVDWFAATAYARFRAEQTGLPYRLPNELEREKAARGVDERLLPWGNHPDATFACVVESHRDEPVRASIHAFPHDESPYGVRGLAGNVRDPCLNLWRREGPLAPGGRLSLDAAAPEDPEVRAVRGGAWGSPLASAWSAGRFASRPGHCWQGMGVRLVRSWPSAAADAPAQLRP